MWCSPAAGNEPTWVMSLRRKMNTVPRREAAYRYVWARSAENATRVTEPKPAP
jgi:hypothetical protein